MTKEQIETLIKKLETCKTTKSAKTILNKKGIETEEGFGKSYSFIINGKKYNVVKNRYDEKCHVNVFKKMRIEKCEPRKVYTCYGKFSIVNERIVIE